MDTDAGQPLRLLKPDPDRDAGIAATFEREDDESARRIRCPRCEWQPPASSRWCCTPVDIPERFEGGCGTVWNTFSTRGLCPGCRHQWRWTKCIRCGGWSLHDDWYEEGQEER